METAWCPLCSSAVPLEGLETHVREELGYAAVRCLLCPLRFASATAAEAHSRQRHPGQDVQLLGLSPDPVKEQRLRELLRLCGQGREAVERRLCVCGGCRLVCREEKLSGETAQHWAPPLEPQGPSPEPCKKPMDQMPSEPQPSTRWSPPQSPPQAPSQPPPSEEEPAAVDVKPSLADLKPQLASDGKVACVQCGVRVSKEGFRNHALKLHSEAGLFSCNLCPESGRTKSELAKHQRTGHGTLLTAETFTLAGSEAQLAEAVERCFGATSESDWARLRCRPCDRLVNKMHLKNHIAQHHLKKPLHACRLCAYTSDSFSAQNLNQHLRKVHKSAPDAETADSAQAQHFAPIIKGMIPKLFASQ